MLDSLFMSYDVNAFRQSACGLPGGDIATQFHALQVVHIDIFCIRFTEDSRYVVYDFVFAV